MGLVSSKWPMFFKDPISLNFEVNLVTSGVVLKICRLRVGFRVGFFFKRFCLSTRLEGYRARARPQATPGTIQTPGFSEITGPQTSGFSESRAPPDLRTDLVSHGPPRPPDLVSHGPQTLTHAPPDPRI